MTMCVRFSLFLLTLFTFCSSEKSFKTTEQTELLMDTVVRISVYHENDSDEADIRSAIVEAFRSISEIDSLANSYNDSSAVATINAHADDGPVAIDATLADIFEQSLRISTLSDGAFDISVLPLLDLWNFAGDAPAVPDSTAIRESLDRVDYRKILLNESSVAFEAEGMRVDLGGIAKGYAVDRAMDVLQRYGFSDAMVNAGGDFKAVSGDLTRGKRKVWIRHPRKSDAFYGYFMMDNGSVATSGDYERYFLEDSLKYHHILDPSTGYPARGCVSVTVRADNVVDADALATAVFVLGPERGVALLNLLDSTEGMVIYEDGGELTHIASDGMKDILQIQHF
ncbi:MAG: FAD:protein FMN transferase [candidate division KSB1 bacterium]|jgi:thiamine biosynthesis lipoprotein|nr:FAD:protein FMN transferase [candidate division KSB1 bacterium]